MVELVIGAIIGVFIHPIFNPPQTPVEVVKNEYCGHCLSPGSEIRIPGIKLKVEVVGDDFIEGVSWIIYRNDFKDWRIYESIDRPGCFYQKKELK